MAMVTRWNVEAVSSTGTALYLAYFGDGIFEWSTDADEAFEYDDEFEAELDAKKYGGDVFQFSRFASRAETLLFPVVFGAQIAAE
ncbi:MULTISPECIES: hypothetical protein [unclassified Sinorhizobium]|uniref:hypothetical protein n=1 Tax=unclassified Sinorhizobium TaxID=2613772 RepID=UPI003524FDF3